MYKTKDMLLSDNFVIKEIEDWKSFLTDEDDEQDKKLLGNTRASEGLWVKKDS